MPLPPLFHPLAHPPAADTLIRFRCSHRGTAPGAGARAITPAGTGTTGTGTARTGTAGTGTRCGAGAVPVRAPARRHLAPQAPAQVQRARLGAADYHATLTYTVVYHATLTYSFSGRTMVLRL